jgi:hypothetical protein
MISPPILELPRDGRQSDRALTICRGTRRLLRAHGHSTVTELSLPNGRRADIVGLAPDGTITIVEVKSCPADFRADRKWPDYREHCDRLFFAISGETSPDLMPADAGLIVADAYGADVFREAPLHKLAPATRRAMLLRFGQAAADRLHLLWDGDCGIPQAL